MSDIALAAGVFLAWAGLSLGVILFLAYRRASLGLSSGVLGLLLLVYWALGTAPLWWKIALSIPYALLLLLNVRPLRMMAVTRPFLRSYRRMLPPMSSTEREALDAGTVWWDGELFTGGPDWTKLMSAKAPTLNATEQAFLDGPCEDLCAMLDDWDITHRRADLPPEVWSFIKSRGFFAMIIPQRYGGLEFSAYAHSCVLIKIASRSAVASSTIAVPNSLGPAELLLHYGTEAQKNHFLPRLARGEEVPCFALAQAPMPLPFPIPASSARAGGKERTSSASSSISRSATSRWRRWRRWWGWLFAFSTQSASWATARTLALPVL